MSRFFTRLYWTAYLGYHLCGQTKYPFKPLSVMKQDQARRVRKMVSYAYRWVPYYRETMDRLGLRPSDFRSAQDLTRLPIIENDHLRRDPECFVSSARALDRYCQVRSGGTTGAPRLVYHDARGLFQDKAHTERSRVIITRLLGQLFRYRETRIVLYQSVGRQTERFLKSHAFWPSIASVERQDILLGDPVEKNAALINEFKPDLIQSYASYLTLLYAHFLRTGEPFHRPRVILYYADAMSDSFKRMMEEELKIPVFSFYGAAEAMGIGFDCEHHLGLHVNIDLYPTRVVDGNGKSLPDGESGDVVVSNLVNRGTVLLNYRLGDISALLPDQCPCGRSLPLVSYPPGRCDDFIRLPSGKIMHPVPLRFIFCDQDVWEYQVIQKTSTSFEVVIIPNQKCDVPKTKERIAERFAQTFGDDITVEISFVESIDRPASGKSRPIVSMVQSSPLDLMPEKGND